MSCVRLFGKTGVREKDHFLLSCDGDYKDFSSGDGKQAILCKGWLDNLD